MAYNSIYGSDLDDSSVLNGMYGGFGPMSQPTSFGGQDEAYLQNLMDDRYLYDDPSQQGVTADEFANDYLNVGDQSQGWMDTLGGLSSKALDWLSKGTNASDLAGLGLGALGMYGNWRAGQDQRGMSAAELALRRELGLKGIDLQRELGLGGQNIQRELGLGNLAIADRGMGLNENQFRLGQGIDDLASKAMGMQLLINRGRMTSDQVNPWLSMMYGGRQQMFEGDPVIGNAFKVNPFSGVPMGAQASMPRSANQFFRELDPSAQQSGMRLFGASDNFPAMQAQQVRNSTPRRMADGGMYQEGALGLLRGGSSGQADDVNANLSHGEYVWDADVVAALGDGNTEAGAAILDQMRERIRAHKRSAPADEIPPPAKDPMTYLGEV